MIRLQDLLSEIQINEQKFFDKGKQDNAGTGFAVTQNPITYSIVVKPSGESYFETYGMLNHKSKLTGNLEYLKSRENIMQMAFNSAREAEQWIDDIIRKAPAAQTNPPAAPGAETNTPTE